MLSDDGVTVGACKYNGPTYNYRHKNTHTHTYARAQTHTSHSPDFDAGTEDAEDDFGIVPEGEEAGVGGADNVVHTVGYLCFQCNNIAKRHQPSEHALAVEQWHTMSL